MRPAGKLFCFVVSSPMTDITPRLLTRREAATLCRIAPSTFSMWVAAGTMPRPIPGTKRWDRLAIEAKLNELSDLAAGQPEDPYDKWMRENEQPNERPASALDEWKKHKKQREKRRPQMGLDANLERVLLYMAERPDLDTIDLIPGAGPSVMAHLVSVGAAKRLRRDRYQLTDEGHQEVARIRKRKRAR